MTRDNSKSGKSILRCFVSQYIIIWALNIIVFYRYDDSSDMDAEEAGTGIEETDVKNCNNYKFKRPYKQLMILAVLLHM